MNNTTNKLILILLCAICSTTFAQEQKKLHLQEALKLSLSNSTALKLSQTQINIAASQIKEAQNKQLPDLKITGMADYLPNTINTSIAALAAGGAGPRMDYITLAQAALSVPLFAGFRITNGVTIAKYNQQLKENNSTAKQEDILLQTIDVFVGLYKAKEAEKVVQANLKRAKETERNFMNMEKNGIVAKNDLLRVQIQESNVELALAETQKNIHVINYNLNLLLGLDENVELDPQLDFNLTDDVALSKNSYQDLAIANRSEIKALDIEEKMAAKKIAISKGDYYPTIALSASDIFLNAHHMGNISNATMVGLSLSYNFSSLFKNKHSVDVAKEEMLEVQETRSLTNDQIHLQIYAAYEDYVLNVKRTQVYQKALEQADENYRIVKNKQENGLANTDDLLTADVAQLQAQLNETYGNADVLLAFYKLTKETGMLSSLFHLNTQKK